MSQIYSGRNPETLVLRRGGGARTPGAPTARKRTGAPTSEVARSARALTDEIVRESTHRLSFAQALAGLPPEKVSVLAEVVLSSRLLREAKAREQAAEDDGVIG